MRIGAVFPQIEIGTDPGAVRDYAQTMEDLGFDHILAFEHVVGGNAETHDLQGPYKHTDMFHEPFVMYGYMAAITKRIELVTGILILPQRQTVLVAKQAATLDLLCGWRFRMGIGVGWNDVEYEALGENFKNRGIRSEEQIDLMRKLWTEDLVTFDGRWHKVTDAGINPLPVQRPIPIWLGGHADATLRRCALMGDGWIPLFPPDDDGAARMEQFRGWVREAGREPSSVGIESWINVGDYDDGFGAPKYDTEQSWRDWAEGWKALGATHLTINTMLAGFTTLQQHIDKLAEVKAVIGSI